MWGYSYREPVKANAAAVVAVAVPVAIGLALSALGISIGAACGVTQCQQFLNDCQNALGNIANDATRIKDGAIALTEPFVTAVGNFWKDTVWKDITTTSEILKQFPNGYLFQKVAIKKDIIKGLYPALTADYNPSYFDDTVYDKIQFLGHVKLADSGSTTNVLIDGRVVKLSYLFGSFPYNCYVYLPNDNNQYTLFGIRPDDWRKCGLDFFTPLAFAYYEVGSDKGYMVVAPQNFNQTIKVKVATASATVGGVESAIPKNEWIASGASIRNNDVATVVEKVKTKVGVKDTDGTTVIPVTNTGSNTAVDQKTTAQTQEQTIGKDIATEADRTANDAANAGQDTSVPKPEIPDLSLPSMVTRKFPFSIPWDLYAAVKGLAATPVPPKFVYPIKLERLGINQSITLDFAPYETLASISRWGITVGFLIWLIIKTRKLIGGGD